MSQIGACTAKVTTLAERKRSEAARLKSAADEVIRELRLYAEAHGGRFVIFGSYVGNVLRFDSDLDVLIDFPVSHAAEAWSFAEEMALRYRVPLDIHDASTSKSTFVERVVSTGLLLS